MGVMFFAGSVGDWHCANQNSSTTPLPQAMKPWWATAPGWLHAGMDWPVRLGGNYGIILGYSRQFFALARAGYLPSLLAKLHASRRRTGPSSPAAW